MSTFSRTILLSTCAFVVSLGMPQLASAAAEPTPAAAPDAAAADDAASGTLSEIVVTAEKRPQNLQSTAIAISVLKGDDLTNRHVQSLLDFGDGAIPSLRVAPFFSRQSALIINVRGVGVLSDSNQPARDQGVGVYIDGVYLGRAQGLGTAIYDVESIEVLKGPQGTLFGRNTEGGAVNIVTRRPSGQFKLNATVGYGNYNSYKGEVHLDLPEYHGFSVKLDGFLSRRDGLTKNPFAASNDFNKYDKQGLHAEVLWKPSSTFSADYSYDVSYDATTSLYMQQLTAPAGAPATATSPAIAPFVLAAATPPAPNRVDVAALGGEEQPSVGKTHGHRFTAEWKAFPEVTFKSITSYRELMQSQYDNGSIAASFNSNPTGNFLNAVFGRYSLAQFRQNQVSEELQAIGSFDRLKFAFGALYYQERVQDNAQAFFDNQFTDAAGLNSKVLFVDQTDVGVGGKAVIQRASYVKTTSVGAYGQATYTPPIGDDIVHLTVGARYTHDKKQGSLFTVNGAAPIVPVNGVNVQAPVLLDYSKSRVDPLVNLAIDASKDIHFYGKFSTGYRSGGANSRSLSYAAFNPETIRMFEIGAKTEFLDHRARLNVAAYTGTYKNIQLDFSGLYQDVVNGVLVNTTRTTTNTVNAPSSGRVKGIEAELTLVPARGLTLSASYAYNSVTIPNTLNPFPQTGGFFITVPIPIYQSYTPEHSASGAIDYEAPVGDVTLRTHLDANYDSGYYANNTDVTYDAVTRAVRFAQPKGDKAFIVNGRIALADIAMPNSSAKVTVAFWVRNLFNEQHVFYKTGSPTAGLSGFFNDQRTFGGELNVKF